MPKVAAHPCGSCPYRKDSPPGLWHPEEYEKLPGYDAETGDQPMGLFLCHQQDGNLCAGWVACHNMEETLAVRLAMLTGDLTVEEVDHLIDYTTPVPVFSSGHEAAEHGLQPMNPHAKRMADRLTRKLSKKEGHHGPECPD